ncbi:MAG: cell division protein FtsB [Thiotrichales bacterium]|nr:cell division protein FtsB [Thiotrichales bacterium]
MLILLLVLLQYRLWFGNGSLTEIHHLVTIKEAQLEENSDLAERNKSLAAEVIDLKGGLDAIEERARSEMGMIRENETFFQIISPSNAKL